MMSTEPHSPRTDTRTNKTHATDVDPLVFISTADITETRRTDALVVLEMMAEITGQPPRMWGPSIIGFGLYHFKYASGREGDTAAAAFSPRKANLVMYGLTESPEAGSLLEKLGKFKSSVACVYINRLADIDVHVLRELIELSYRNATTTTDPESESKSESR
ncbi:DUF1801 domain-containing protein [Arthrobacter sp. TMN-49]